MEEKDKQKVFYVIESEDEVNTFKTLREAIDTIVDRDFLFTGKETIFTFAKTKTDDVEDEEAKEEWSIQPVAISEVIKAFEEKWNDLHANSSE